MLDGIKYGVPRFQIPADSRFPVRVEKIGSLFSKMFNIKEHLDVIFLNDESEKRVASVAEPFYSTKKE